MPLWNFNTPYRLLDSRTACGLQVVVDDAAAAYAAIPEIWKRLPEWKRNVKCAIDDCSLELAGVRFIEDSCYVLRWGLFLRIAAPAVCSDSALCTATGKLKGFLCAYLKEAGIKFRDDEDDKAVLAHFPCWDAGTANKLWIGSFAKKVETIEADGELLAWYRELQPNGEQEMSGILRIMERNACCGLSLEIHAMPESVRSKAGGYSVQDADCAQWLKKIEDGKVVSARLMYWGDRDFDEAIKKAVNKRFPTLDQGILTYTRELSNYMVYDPWAYIDVLVRKTASGLRLGAAKYALTLDEIGRLCAPGKKREQTEPLKEAMLPVDPQKQAAGQVQPAPAQPADQTDFAQRVAEAVAEKLGGRISQIICDIGALSGKMDKLAELAQTCEKIVPAGCEIAFTADELKWLGIENEAELCTRYGMEKEAVRLLKTALTLARLGMDMDENDTAFMAFSTPLGAFYEYMMRRYFAPKLYQHVLPVPPKKPSEDPPRTKKNPDLGDFDSIIQWCAWPYRNYEEHVQIEGEKRSDFYWLSWLNIMKPVREIRNKVHPERGEASKEELKMLYEVLLKPGIKPKIEALKYGYGKRILFLCKSDSTRWYHNEFLEKMNTNMEWFTPSLFHFILKCGKAEWV